VLYPQVSSSFNNFLFKSLRQAYFLKLQLYLVFITFSLMATQIFASNSSNQRTEGLLEASKSRTWHFLLGYTDQEESDILTKSFFLTPEGKSKPYNELIATLKSFTKPTNIDTPDQHPQCIFRARYYFLDKQLNLKEHGVTPQTCPGFSAFSYEGEVTGISLVFATGYFGNPASYYGHFLLKLETDKASIKDLEKTTINFGAIFPPDENAMVYILKGIFGGYDSVYKEQQYYQQSLNYGEGELRDVWEYALNFTREESRFITAHLWELLGVKYTYYFFDRNCAYRMATVFELVLNTKLADTNSLWQIPQHVIQQLSSTNHRGSPLIKSVKYIPSRQSRLYQRFLGLNELEKDWLNQLTYNITLIESSNFDDLPLQTKYRLLDVLLDYYQYLIIKEYINEDIAEEHHRAVLNKRFRIQAGISKISFKPGNPPHLGRRPSYVQIGAIDKNGNGETSIKIRPAYYDPLDYGSGHTRNSSLIMGELDLETRDSVWIVKSFGIVKIENIQRNVTNLPGDNMHSWYLNSGFINDPDDCKSCMEFEFNGGIGLSNSFASDNFVLSGFLGGGIEGENLRQEIFYATGRVVLNASFSPAFRLRIEIKNDHFIEENKDRTAYTLEGRVKLTTNSDIRVLLEDINELETKLAVGYYW
jgi:hypothetical protein